MTRSGHEEGRGGPDRRQVTATFVALATSGLSGCNDQGAVDPPPPPFRCDTVGAGQTLVAEALRNGTTLTIHIEHAGHQQWSLINVRDLVGATLVETTIPNGTRVTVTLELESAAVTQGEFTFEGQLTVSDGTTCFVQRTFSFEIANGAVQVASLRGNALPLAVRDQAEILLVERAGRRVELSARTSYRGSSSLSWNVSGGSVLWESRRRLAWELPAEPGLYQVELVADFGDDGLAIDTLAFEVT